MGRKRERKIQDSIGKVLRKKGNEEKGNYGEQ